MDALISPPGALVTCGISTLRERQSLNHYSCHLRARVAWTEVSEHKGITDPRTSPTTQSRAEEIKCHGKQRRNPANTTAESVPRERKFCSSIACDSFPGNYTFFFCLHINLANFLPLPVKEMLYPSVCGIYHFSHSCTPAMSLA